MKKQAKNEPISRRAKPPGKRQSANGLPQQQQPVSSPAARTRIFCTAQLHLARFSAEIKFQEFAPSRKIPITEFLLAARNPPPPLPPRAAL